MALNVGEVLTQAWRILWKYKVLWIFGILAGCSGGGVQVNYSFSGNDFGTLPPRMQYGINQLSLHPGVVAALVAGIAAFICVLVLFFLALGAFGRIGLIIGTQKADAGTTRLPFGELVEAGKPYFWRIYGLYLLLGLVGFLLVVIFTAFFVAFAAVTLGVGVLCLMPLLCLFIPLMWLVAVIIEQAEIAIVLEDLSIPDGLTRGWQVINANWGSMIVMALILFLGMAVVSVVIALPFIVIALPTTFAFLAGGPSARNALLALGLVCACIYLPVLILLNGIIQTYYHSAWTLTFLRLTGHAPALPGPDEATGSTPPVPMNA